MEQWALPSPWAHLPRAQGALEMLDTAAGDWVSFSSFGGDWSLDILEDQS
jgi:hypothetical protein